MTDKKSAVMGEGPVPAPVMLVGQNPGKEELKAGAANIWTRRSGKAALTETVFTSLQLYTWQGHNC